MPDVMREMHAPRADRASRQERALAELARGQHGVVAHGQLLRLGIRRGAVRHRIEIGRLHRLHAGVYAVGHAVLTSNGHYMAAVLACGPDSSLSHRSAAGQRELRRCARTRVDVTTTGRQRSQPGVDVHHTTLLHPEDVTLVDGIPTTSVARTLLDLAEVVSLHNLERAWEEAERRRLLDLDALERVCQRNPGRRGLKPIVRLLREARPVHDTRSELERRFLGLCRQAGVPEPAMNVDADGHDCDAVWYNRHLVIEIDGDAVHRTRAAVERDRRKDAKLTLAGWRVVRIGEQRLKSDPAGVIALLRALLR